MKRSTLLISIVVAAALLGAAWWMLGSRTGVAAGDRVEVVVHKDPG